MFSTQTSKLCRNIDSKKKRPEMSARTPIRVNDLGSVWAPATKLYSSIIAPPPKPAYASRMNGKACQSVVSEATHAPCFLPLDTWLPPEPVPETRRRNPRTPAARVGASRAPIPARIAHGLKGPLMNQRRPRVISQYCSVPIAQLLHSHIL